MPNKCLSERDCSFNVAPTRDPYFTFYQSVMYGKPTNQLTTNTTNLPINQQTNQPKNQPILHSLNQSTKQLTPDKQRIKLNVLHISLSNIGIRLPHLRYPRIPNTIATIFPIQRTPRNSTVFLTLHSFRLLTLSCLFILLILILPLPLTFLLPITLT